MENKKRRAVIYALLSLLVAVFLKLTLGAEKAARHDYAQKVVLAGTVPNVVRSHDAQPSQPVDPNKQVEITLWLKYQNVDDLKKYIVNLYTPGAPEFHHYMTLDDFINRYCPSQADYDQVKQFLTSQGLTIVDATAPNRRFIVARGTVAQIKHAFGINVKSYNYRGKVYMSNDSDPMIPAQLYGVIESVMGLNTFAQFHAKNRLTGKKADDDEPFGLTPNQVATAYNFPSPTNPVDGSRYTGQGRSIAVVGAYGYDYDKDVAPFWSKFNIKRSRPIDIYVGPQGTKLGDETTLDVEQAGAYAPGADLYVYITQDPDDMNFARVFNYVVTDRKHPIDIISFSWGAAEAELDPAAMQSLNGIYLEAMAQGIAVFCASGDDGAYDGRDKKNKDLLLVDYPSSDPSVVAVGGTRLFYDDKNPRKSEVAWAGSGGGVSGQWPRPAWQYGPGVPPGDKRMTADVSLMASPWFGYAMRYKGEWTMLNGGTSFAAPVMASYWALVEEECGGRVGTVNAILYAAGRSAQYHQVFYDITQGFNSGSHGPTAGYAAGAGWDCPTGWGAPNGRALSDWVRDYIKQKPVSSQ